MVEFKLSLSDPSEGKAYKADLKGAHANALVGKRIGDEIDGIFVGLPGYRLVLTGGSDRQGVPMRGDVRSAVRKRVLLTSGVGFRAPKGLRKRKMVRGDIISPDIWQINFTITKRGTRDISELLVGGESEQ